MCVGRLRGLDERRELEILIKQPRRALLEFDFLAHHETGRIKTGETAHERSRFESLSRCGLGTDILHHEHVEAALEERGERQTLPIGRPRRREAARQCIGHGVRCAAGRIDQIEIVDAVLVRNEADTVAIRRIRRRHILGIIIGERRHRARCQVGFEDVVAPVFEFRGALLARQHQWRGTVGRTVTGKDDLGAVGTVARILLVVAVVRQA